MKALLAFTLAFSSAVWSQERGPLERYLYAATAYETCVLAYAKRFAKTTEAPSDIAAAAISSCVKEKSDFHVAVLLMEFKDDAVVLSNFEKSYRDSAVRTVLEARYPDAR